MEDLKKYIFDLEDPKGFKTYDLLLKVIKDKNNIAFFDPYFYVALFEKDVFDKKIIEDLWDKPDNFEDLNIKEKVKIFINNFSETEFEELMISNSVKWEDSKIRSLFFLLFSGIEWTEEAYQYAQKNGSYILSDGLEINQEIIISEIYFDILHKRYRKEELNRFQTIHQETKVISLTSEYSYFLDYLDFNKSTVLITTIKDYNEIQTKIKTLNNIKPILLKNLRDINKLLDFISRDLKAASNEEDNAFQLKITCLDRLQVQNYFSIKNIEINNLKEKKEIYFLGENGDGKTILLQAILLALKGNKNEGLVTDFIKSNFVNNLILKALDSEDIQYEFKENPKDQTNSYQNVFGYGVSRYRNDSEKKDKTGYLTMFNNEQYLENPVKWLQHIDYKESKGLPAVISLIKAKELLNELLDKNIEIEVNPDKVIFKERGTELSFEQLSDGYKSMISWIGDLITRLSENQPNIEKIEDFKGIVLIDEIDMFLHPKWEYTIVKKLRIKFPLIQFLFTTHSPILILGASEDAIFYKLFKEDGATRISEPYLAKDMIHLMANGIISSPLFDMEDISDIENDDYYYSEIHKQIKLALKKKKKQGKSLISKSELSQMINNAIEHFQK